MAWRLWEAWGRLNFKIPSYYYRIPIIKIRWSHGRFISIMRIIIPRRKVVYILRRRPGNKYIVLNWQRFCRLFCYTQQRLKHDKYCNHCATHCVGLNKWSSEVRHVSTYKMVIQISHRKVSRCSKSWVPFIKHGLIWIRHEYIITFTTKCGMKWHIYCLTSMMLYVISSQTLLGMCLLIYGCIKDNPS